MEQNPVLQLLRDNPATRPHDRRPWPYHRDKGTSRAVGAYNRPDSEIVQLYFYDDRGRQQMSMRTVTGQPITDKSLARDIVDAIYEAQQAKRVKAQRQVTVGDRALTLKALADRYHNSDDAKGWSDSHRKGQERCRDFWFSKLGEDVAAGAVGLDEDRVAVIASEAAKERGWSKRTRNAYIVYLRSLLNFGRKKLGVLDERQTITGIKIPQWKGHRTDLTYSDEEEDRLVPALREVDLRGFVVWEAYVQAGRRMNATRLLAADAVRFENVRTKYGKVRLAIVTYPGETDKKSRGDEIVPDEESALCGDVVAALEELLATPASRATGLLLPDGDLQADDPAAGPVTHEHLYDFLAAAQKRAKVKDVRYRKYHAGKRRFSDNQDDLEAASAQSGTSGGTLRKYRPKELVTKAELAVRMERDRKKRRKRG